MICGQASFHILLLLLAWFLPSMTSAWMTMIPQSIVLKKGRAASSLIYHRRTTASILRMSDVEEEDELTSFEDAERELKEQLSNIEDVMMDDETALLPDSDYATQEELRDVIRQRTAGLNLEESENTKKYLEQAKKRAMENRGSRGDEWAGIDLSQINAEPPRLTKDKDGEEDLDFFEYLKKMEQEQQEEEELPEEEKREADPLYDLPFPIQLIETLKGVSWPSFPEVLFNTFLLIFLFVAFVGSTIYTDIYGRKFFEYIGVSPSKEEVDAYVTAQQALVKELTTGGTAADVSANGAGAVDAAGAGAVDAAARATAADVAARAAKAASRGEGIFRWPTWEDVLGFGLTGGNPFAAL